MGRLQPDSHPDQRHHSREPARLGARRCAPQKFVPALQRRFDRRAAEIFSQPRVYAGERCRHLSKSHPVRLASGRDDCVFLGGNDKLYAMSRLEFEVRQIIRRQYQFDPFFACEKDMANWEKILPAFAPGYPRICLDHRAVCRYFWKVKARPLAGSRAHSPPRKKAIPAAARSHRTGFWVQGFRQLRLQRSAEHCR